MKALLVSAKLNVGEHESPGIMHMGPYGLTDEFPGGPIQQCERLRDSIRDDFPEHTFSIIADDDAHNRMGAFRSVCMLKGQAAATHEAVENWMREVQDD